MYEVTEAAEWTQQRASEYLEVDPQIPGHCRRSEAGGPSAASGHVLATTDGCWE